MVERCLPLRPTRRAQGLKWGKGCCPCRDSSLLTPGTCVAFAPTMACPELSDSSLCLAKRLPGPRLVLTRTLARTQGPMR